MGSISTKSFSSSQLEGLVQDYDSFSYPTPTLYGDFDDLTTPSGNIVLGRPNLTGTGCST